MKKNTKSGVDLLKNPKFKNFINSFSNLSKASQKISLDESRKLGTYFFLSEAVYETIKNVTNIEILGREKNTIALRIFEPDLSHPTPTIVFFHRGGWVFGNINEAEPLCRKLANHLGCTIVAVEYRLAPENPFPKPLNDCYDATAWVAEHIHNINSKSSCLIVCGESAGGNLAASVAMMARDLKGPEIAAQVLIYPVISSQVNNVAYEACVDRYFLTKEAMKQFWKMYIQLPEDLKNPYASLDQAESYKDLAPALIITAEYDPLHLEAANFAHCLNQAGVPVIEKCFPEVIHGFLDLPMYEENEKVTWIKEIDQLLKKILLKK